MAKQECRDRLPVPPAHDSTDESDLHRIFEILRHLESNDSNFLRFVIHDISLKKKTNYTGSST